ncbi:Imm61 family immunity protein [Mycolicibacterium baixiangningiae]|uniref:Imm61 family immunity protein n=1 Tax=Mycolicibacterium baixiangningiae TaxID=2761578 RepID=UPI0018672310|nr:Imm61 family immunity protein [Mycolicibacterium baixiangningiae]
MSALSPSHELTTWANRAGYSVTASDKTNATVFWSDPGGEIRYYCRNEDDEHIRLTRVTRDGPEELVLIAATFAILQRYMIGRFGNVIRDELGLDVLRPPWTADQLAEGYALTDMDDDGCRALLRNGSVVAKAPEATLSLLALVPLSHYMRLSTADLMDSFLDPHGAPLLANGRYA